MRAQRVCTARVRRTCTARARRVCIACAARVQARLGVAVEPQVPVVAQVAVLLEQVHQLDHLREDQHPVAERLQHNGVLACWHAGMVVVWWCNDVRVETQQSAHTHMHQSHMHVVRLGRHMSQRRAAVPPQPFAHGRPAQRLDAVGGLDTQGCRMARRVARL